VGGIATGVLAATHVGNASICELLCSYIAAGIFEIVGILVTVQTLTKVSWNGDILAGG
jgi:hypothetical protein